MGSYLIMRFHTYWLVAFVTLPYYFQLTKIRKTYAYLQSTIINNFLRYVPVNSIDKIFCPCLRNLSSNLTYNKNQLASWLDNKEKSSWNERHRFKSYHIFKNNNNNYNLKKKKILWFAFLKYKRKNFTFQFLNWSWVIVSSTSKPLSSLH